MGKLSKESLKEELKLIMNLKNAVLDNTYAKKVRLELQDKMEIDLSQMKKEVHKLVMEIITEQTEEEEDEEDEVDEMEEQKEPVKISAPKSEEKEKEQTEPVTMAAPKSEEKEEEQIEPVKIPDTKPQDNDYESSTETKIKDSDCEEVSDGSASDDDPDPSKIKKPAAKREGREKRPAPKTKPKYYDSDSDIEISGGEPAAKREVREKRPAPKTKSQDNVYESSTETKIKDSDCESGIEIEEVSDGSESDDDPDDPDPFKIKKPAAKREGREKIPAPKTKSKYYESDSDIEEVSGGAESDYEPDEPVRVRKPPVKRGGRKKRFASDAGESSGEEWGETKSVKRKPAPRKKRGVRSASTCPSDSDSDYPPSNKRRGGGGGGLTAPITLSKELAEVVGGDKMPRHAVVKKMWAYIKENKLQDPKNKQFIKCDDKLAKIFGTKKFRGFGMTKHLKEHMGV